MVPAVSTARHSPLESYGEFDSNCWERKRLWFESRMNKIENTQMNTVLLLILLRNVSLDVVNESLSSIFVLDSFQSTNNLNTMRIDSQINTASLFRSIIRT